MLHKIANIGYRSTVLDSIPSVFHAYTTRQHGDMREREVKCSYLAMIHEDPTMLVWPQQVHGTDVCILTSLQTGVISNMDGLIYQKHHDLDPILTVHTADCIPMLLVDPKKKIIGVAHAGWKGTLGNMAGCMITMFQKLGSDVSDICVSIGPHICMSCYAVPIERATKFQTLLGHDAHLAVKKKENWHIDIGYANKLQLLSLGVQISHIDMSDVCTSCRNDEFFSFRKDTKESFGETMGVIGFKHS